MGKAKTTPHEMELSLQADFNYDMNGGGWKEKGIIKEK